MTELKCPRCGSEKLIGFSYQPSEYVCKECNFSANVKEFREDKEVFSHCNECKTAFEKYNPCSGKPLTRCPKCNSWQIGILGGSFKETKGLWYNPSQRRNDE